MSRRLSNCTFCTKMCKKRARPEVLSVYQNEKKTTQEYISREKRSSFFTKNVHKKKWKDPKFFSNSLLKRNAVINHKIRMIVFCKNLGNTHEVKIQITAPLPKLGPFLHLIVKRSNACWRILMSSHWVICDLKELENQYVFLLTLH